MQLDQPNRNRMSYFVTLLIASVVFLNIALLPIAAQAKGPMCLELFTLKSSSVGDLFEDHRINFDQNAVDGRIKVGEGNSGSVFLYKNTLGEFMVAKFYKPERADNLQRDHDGLNRVQKLFENTTMHSIKFRVAQTYIVHDFNNVKGQEILAMPYVPGVNLHKLLVSLKGGPNHHESIELYNQFIRELDTTAVRLGIKDEVRPETDRYFQDHIVDGLPMLIIEGNPRVLIKTDNIIYNPEDHSLTLVDPY